MFLILSQFSLSSHSSLLTLTHSTAGGCDTAVAGAVDENPPHGSGANGSCSGAEEEVELMHITPIHCMYMY